MTQEMFIERVMKIHGDKYDYSKVIYTGLKNKIIVIDKRTGNEKLMRPKKLLYREYISKTKEEKANAFIMKSKEKFGDKFDYSRVEYIDSLTPVTLICKEHGEFSVNMYRHLYSKDGLCPLCNEKFVNKHDIGRSGSNYIIRSGAKLSTEYLIKKCQYFYGDKYDYSKVKYDGCGSKKGKVEIICPKHGSFFKCIDNINKRDTGCPMCSKEIHKVENKISDANRFIENSRKKFGDRFDYSEVEYVDSLTPVTLMCKEHGVIFSVTPNVHLTSRFGGCKECYSQYLESNRKPSKPKLTEEERKERRTECLKNLFIRRATKKFGDRYDYSKVEYIDSNTPVDIIDKENGNEVFSIKPSSFLSSANGRPGSGRVSVTTEEFIERARKLHGNKYDYSKVVYKNGHEKVCIICPIHGEFWQEPHNHLISTRKGGCGCPKCANTVSKLEADVINRLTEEDIKFNKEYKDKNIFGNMRGDFFLKHYNVMIECQGSQHFKENNSLHNAYGGSLFNQIERDYKFNRCCKNADINLLYYFDKDNASGVDYLNDKKFNGIYTEENTFTNIDSLVSCIKCGQP